MSCFMSNSFRGTQTTRKKNSGDQITMADVARSNSIVSDGHTETMGPCVLKLLVSDRQAGKLIGKHGATVSQIGQSFHVALRVSCSNMFFPGTTDRVVLIGGEVANIETALRTVQDRVANPVTESQTIVMVVHSSLLTNLIGVGSAHLHRVANEFGVSIQVTPKPDSVPERMVRVTHRSSSQSVIGAVLALGTRIMSEPATLANLNMYYDSPSASRHTSTSVVELYLSGITVDAEGAATGSDEEAHLAAASLLPLDEIKVDTDLLKGKRTAEADELICKICHTYFLGCAPKLTKCGHAFCGDCLESWIQVQPTFRSWAQVAKTAGQARLVPCPVCKAPLNDKTDIHLILTEITDPECARMAASLRKLPLVCHNNKDINPEGSCPWEGSYMQYQQHAKHCTANKSKSPVETNTVAPPQSHERASDIDRDQATIMIPFTECFKDTISVQPGQRVAIHERTEEGWIYVKNFTAGTQGWVPDYCIKRYDAWFEDVMGAVGKHVEKCSAIRDFDPKSDPAVASHSTQFQFLPLREGEVFTVCERAKNGWNLVINSDGSRQGWVPDNRCKVIREGSDSVGSSEHHTQVATVRSYVVRRAFTGDEKKGELSLNPGETVAVRQTQDAGWTLGVVVAGGSRKEGWFPDWAIDRALIDPKNLACAQCGINNHQPISFVRIAGPQLGRPQDLYGPVCSRACWDQWTQRRAAAPKPGQRR